jgi:hypothetical protein
MGKGKDNSKEKAPMLYEKENSMKNPSNGNSKSTIKVGKSIWAFKKNEWRLRFGNIGFLIYIILILPVCVFIKS